MNKNLYTNLIQACNQCILSSEKSLNKCSYYANNSPEVDKEDCGAAHQKLINDCQNCIHECNVVLENKQTKSTEQEKIIKNCKKACQETIDKCQKSIDKMLNNEKDGIIWALDQINNFITMCDECIETLSKNN